MSLYIFSLHHLLCWLSIEKWWKSNCIKGMDTFCSEKSTFTFVKVVKSHYDDDDDDDDDELW